MLRNEASTLSAPGLHRRASAILLRMSPEGLFITFLQRIGKGQCSREDWKSYAVTHYHDPLVEKARRALVRAAIEIDFNANGTVPPSLIATAQELSATFAEETAATPR
jgi:hypothetical protein